MGVDRSRWTLPTLLTTCDWLALTVPSSLCHLLQRLGIAYKRGRDYLHSPDPDYLAKKGLEVVNSGQDVVTSGAVTGDILAQLRAGKLYIRQMPGPKNSLGLVKFIFPNSSNVYMHDTPAQEFFAKSRRDFSHGCIRLEKPADLAMWVLHENPGWDMDRVRTAMNEAPNQQVNLAHPIPVLIVYGTAIVTEDGIVHFYDDIYGHDAVLEKALAKGYPYPV